MQFLFSPLSTRDIENELFQVLCRQYILFCDKLQRLKIRDFDFTVKSRNDSHFKAIK